MSHEPVNTESEEETSRAITHDEATVPDGAADSVNSASEVAALTEQLAQAERKAAENWDRAVRMQAEMENLKRRVQKDVENAHKFALENFARELLPVLDSLELGIQASTGEVTEVVKLREGMELTLKQFHAALAKFNIEIIDPVGQAFNPECHQAMSMQATAQVDPNTILAVFQKGYALNGRLLRPAMVVVSKAIESPAENLPSIDEQA